MIKFVVHLSLAKDDDSIKTSPTIYQDFTLHLIHPLHQILFNAVVEAEEALLAEQANYASLWAAEAGSSSSSEAEEEDQKAS